MTEKGIVQNILIVTDLHASQSALALLDDHLAQHRYSAVIMAGDLINPNNNELPYVERFIDKISIKHHLPLFGLHGNNEPEAAFAIYRHREINIHLQTRQLGSYNVCGIGGFGYLNETGFEDLSVENLIINQQTIFVTHVPPRAGQRPARGPLIHLYGHRHTLAYTKQLNSTLLVQCPAGNLNKATILELPSKKITFIDLGQNN